ncbi:hypothetical protein [Paenibacillus dendritiformis]|uniref:hypothetical protein n=1 Tax=Paenibacillus dendritiformis TaxID=130049 RepID=UPI00387E14F9
MKKSALLLSMCLSLGLLFSAVSPAASAEQAQNLSLSSDIAPMVNTGWVKKNGIEARVYTDRLDDYPVSDTYVGVTAEKKAAGGTVYYQIVLSKVKSDGTTYYVDSVYGSMSSKSPQAKFYIDDFLDKGSSGTYRVMLKIFKDKEYDDWVGDWITDSFKIYN